MAAPFNISVDVSDLAQAVTMARAAMFSNLADAVRRVAETGVSRWQQAVFAAPLWEGELLKQFDGRPARAGMPPQSTSSGFERLGQSVVHAGLPARP